MHNVTCDFNSYSCIAMYSSKIFLNKEVQIIPQPPHPLQRMYWLRKKMKGLRMIFFGNECSNLPCGTYRRALVLIRPAVGIQSPNLRYLFECHGGSHLLTLRGDPSCKDAAKGKYISRSRWSKTFCLLSLFPCRPSHQVQSTYCMVSSGQIPSRPIHSLSETLPQNGSWMWRKCHRVFC